MLTIVVSSMSCSSTSSPPTSNVDAGTDTPADSGAEHVFGGDRPVEVRVPEGYDAKKPAPLLMMLHGHGASGLSFELYLKMISIADKHGFFYVAPDGTEDSKHVRFWNATDACCADGKPVDDVAYLTGLVKEIQSVYSIDPQRIYVLGHSNGGFMAHRLACEHAETFAAIASFAGATWTDESSCKPSGPVGVLQIHGTADDTVLYAGTSTPGGGLLGTYPGAEQTVATWAKKMGCADPLTDTGTKIHVDADLKGTETSVLRHAACPQNGAAELWKVEGGPHIFAFAPEALETTWKFFEDHAKPSR
ncbi:MAG: PHB depolymerase family esterase [Polyangiales bacterium]